MKEKLDLKIAGMTCEHCAKKIKDIILSQDGVLKAKVSNKKGLAHIKINEKADIDAIKSAISATEIYKAI